MLGIINIILGLGLLIAGRRLFWLFVAAAGFIAGVQLTVRAWNGPEWMAIVVGLIVGALFAILAMFLKSVAIGVAGFIAGGAVLLGIAHLFGFDTGLMVWILFIIGGIIGAILVGALFDWAIITLSSLAGAALLVQVFNLKAAMGGLTFLVIVIVGVAIQGEQLRREQRTKHD
ncbi:MAG TPA: hypothetical protein VMT73_08885 [Anaerolineales bacterium]|nr:hypothetical protein [Anaerolineales bacterium]